MSDPIPHRPSMTSSSSDEPLIIDPPAHLSTPNNKAKRNARAGPSSTSKSRSVPRASGPRSSIGKGKVLVEINSDTDDDEKEARRNGKVDVNTVDQEGDEDDDDPVFVGSNGRLSEIAERYKFRPTFNKSLSSTSTSASTARLQARANGNGSESGSGSGAIPRSKSKSGTVSRSPSIGVASSSLLPTTTPKQRTKAPTTATKKSRLKSIAITSQKQEDTSQPQSQPPPLPLLPDLALEPLPVPNWLGKTAVLLQLPGCAVCKVRFKKSDSGAARWRHMSACRPPLYRPPNPPPNLQLLIHQALHDLAKPAHPTSLLDLHVRSASKDKDSPVKGSGAPSGSRKGLVGLASVTLVKPTDERGEGWGEEVRERIREWIGPSSPVCEDQDETPFHFVPVEAEDTEQEEKGVDLPGTQPLGESSLAQIYGKSSRGNSHSPSPTPSGSTHLSLTTEDEDDEDEVDQETPEDQLPESPPRIEEEELHIPPPSSQKRSRSTSMRNSYSDDESDSEGEPEPFRKWGDLRVDGNLSGRNGSTAAGLAAARGWGAGRGSEEGIFVAWGGGGR
ncbi:hypothetical protein CI109_106549 [Kwoniella shandongensis]|uniref:Uncharacterized protein n=1 Tax=Kwoniella shandongensis TaxID=1734106 RepID=A0A5M6C5D8_9TREE|nr:uncharacterized protein CI109_002729 [Kwoniella shandongensis]KAA5528972.1 hypothetical protein CI109_002729 [Kwoniella shandongensis]